MDEFRIYISPKKKVSSPIVRYETFGSSTMYPITLDLQILGLNLSQVCVCSRSANVIDQMF